MADDLEKPDSGAGEEKPPKIKAEDNPWYLLATLYGVSGDDKTINKNRVTWNRYFAVNLDEEIRTKLIEEKRHSGEELRPFSQMELDEVATVFAERRVASGKKLALPARDANIDFSNVNFEQDANFQRYLFSKSTSFRASIFSGRASFNDATFSGRAYSSRPTFYFEATFEDEVISVEVSFEHATFSGEASFERATFSGGVNFGRAIFSIWASFGHATFSHWASFGHVTFFSGAFFGGAAFSGRAYFGGAAFSGVADFDGATFSGEADFRKATFGETSRFVNAEMKGTTSFEGAVFKTQAPRFFGAKLHQGTVWRGIKWPPRPEDKDEAGRFIDAYACLKLEMDRLKKHEDELDFFTLELQSRHVLLGPSRGLPIALFGVFSDYGRSYLRPLAWLIVIAVACAPVFWHFGAKAPIDSLCLSLANLLSVFGFRKDFNLTIDSLPAALKILAAIQTILGTILLFLFLFGLGIRNKFRMK